MKSRLLSSVGGLKSIVEWHSKVKHGASVERDRRNQAANEALRAVSFREFCMLPECSKPISYSLRESLPLSPPGSASRPALLLRMARFSRFLLIALLAVMIAAPPYRCVAALGAFLPHHTPLRRLPQHHSRIPTVVKMTSDYTASARLTARAAPDRKARTANRPVSPSSSHFHPGQPPDNPGLNRVFRPLRC